MSSLGFLIVSGNSLANGKGLILIGIKGGKNWFNESIISLSITIASDLSCFKYKSFSLILSLTYWLSNILYFSIKLLYF